MKVRTYHVGLCLVQHSRGYRAVYQFARCLDYLSCELYEYNGERETTIIGARARLKQSYRDVLGKVRAKFPEKVITSVGVQR